MEKGNQIKIYNARFATLSLKIHNGLIGTSISTGGKRRLAVRNDWTTAVKAGFEINIVRSQR